MSLSAAYKILVEGVIELDFHGRSVPCDLMLTGNTSFPVLVNPQNQVLIAASMYGQGRMVVLSHEDYLNNPKFFKFLQNAINWLKPSPQALVGIQKKFDFLTKTLSNSGTKVLAVTEFSDSFGVYCTDAYDEYQAEELVMFVKRGGGLLIGGQAWWWAQLHRDKKDILSFPGNKVTAVSGIHFTSKYAIKGTFPISTDMPTIPLTVNHGIDINKDLTILLDGVSELDITTRGTPSVLLIHGPLAFPIAQDDHHQSFLAAAHFGKGRVVVATHEDQLSSPLLKTFILNAVSWVGTGKKGKIGIESSLKGLHALLSEENIDCELTDLVSSLSVFCCNSYTAQEAEKIHEFVAEGGGLLIGGQAWYWASQNPGKNPVTEYPGNKILNKFGICILGHAIRDRNKPLHRVDGSNCYHFRKALSQLQQHINDEDESSTQEYPWLGALRKDYRALMKVIDEDSPTFSSIQKQMGKIVSNTTIPMVGEQYPIKNNSKEAFLLILASELHNNSQGGECLEAQACEIKHLYDPLTFHLTINCTNMGPTTWRSTGLYLTSQSTGVLTFPPSIVGAGLQVQIGCHSDDLSSAQQFCRAPVVIQSLTVNQERMCVTSLWGGLIYIIVPKDCQLDNIPLSVEGAIQAPFFEHGKTDHSEWLQNIRHYPAPWAELATENLILTVPSESVRPIENPATLLSLWGRIMRAICELSAIPSPVQRPERIVADVQISAGLMHAGYPIMCHLKSVNHLVDFEYIEANGAWGFIHELGHNQQQCGWEFPPHTTEATCNLWAVYVHEKVLGIPRHKAHPALQPRERCERIKTYVRNGAQLDEWNVWKCLETYLQLQEGFGWEPFIQLFSDYQKLTNIRKENIYKMNLWAELFSEKVKRNLTPFFQAWGWPIEDKIAQKLSTLPEWEENPMVAFLSDQFLCQQIY